MPRKPNPESAEDAERYARLEAEMMADAAEYTRLDAERKAAEAQRILADAEKRKRRGKPGRPPVHQTEEARLEASNKKHERYNAKRKPMTEAQKKKAKAKRAARDKANRERAERLIDSNAERRAILLGLMGEGGATLAASSERAPRARGHRTTPTPPVTPEGGVTDRDRKKYIKNPEYNPSLYDSRQHQKEKAGVRRARRMQGEDEKPLRLGVKVKGVQVVEKYGEDYQPKTAREVRECLRNPLWRLNNLYKILVKTDENDEGLVKEFHLDREERKLLKRMHTRNVVLKARQMGITTFVCIYFLDCCLFRKNVRAGIIAQDLTAVEVIFRDKVKFAYDHLPEGLKRCMPLSLGTKKELM